MRTELKKIVLKRIADKKTLEALKIQYLLTLWNNPKNLHKVLYDQTINSKVQSKLLFKAVTQVARRTQQLHKKEDSGALVFFAIDKAFMDLEKPINEDLRRQEDNEKKKLLDDFTKTDKTKIFYLCSSHSDCASDHQDYQGKVYVDKNWTHHIHDQNTRNLIYSYINKHNIKTFQWVVGKPVYMFSRPYCRHFFVKMSVEETLKTSVANLIKKHNTHINIGDRTVMQTAKSKGATKKQMIKLYEDRLNLHLKMYQAKPTDFLKKAINKDKFLLQKWKK